MSFTDQEPFKVTEEHLGRNWGGRGLELFRCYLCGHKFVIGNTVRWIFTNSHPQLPPGNPFVCESCDGDDVQKRMAEQHAEAKSDKWWYYRERER